MPKVTRPLAPSLVALLLVACNPPVQTIDETPREGRRGKRVQPTLDTPPPTSTPTLDGIEVEVEEGEVVGPEAVTVDVGQVVAFEITADVEDQVHVHGYNVVADVGPGQDALFQFDATLAGVFDVELVRSKLHLLELRVED